MSAPKKTTVCCEIIIITVNATADVRLLFRRYCIVPGWFITVLACKNAQNLHLKIGKLNMWWEIKLFYL